MAAFQVAYLPIGVPTFHLETARARVEKTRDLLADIIFDLGFSEEALAAPEDLLLSVDAVEEFLAGQTPSLVVLQNATFANGAYTEAVLAATDAPVLLWSLRDPAADGSRLKLNSLTGAFSAGNRMVHAGRTFLYVLGEPDEEACVSEVRAVLAAAACKARLAGAKLGSIGEPPQGFDFGRVDAAALAETFGMEAETLDIHELFTQAKAFSGAELHTYIDEAYALFPGLDAIPKENVRGYAALMKAYEDTVREHAFAAISSRCWPDCFVDFGTPVCAVLSLLGDRGIPASCEGDAAGALSMLIGYMLSGRAVFFGDPVAVDAEANTITFWHCGAGAPSLARADEGPAVGVHANRRIGPTMNFGCKAADAVTVFRVGQCADGRFRFFVGKGSALDAPRQYQGTSIVVCWDGGVEDMVKRAVAAGWEPHFAVIYGDVAAELSALARLYGLEAERF